ncbi:MAG: hypothetical protein ACD_3C00100G0016 [uncultured bacterium (gcode 4)]|uniref:Uncharacterized protein n=1 Tax=uncultured bacterium (gcode 4) TaxID=1234023 RepID=K2FAE9_9BACT|nr:MAG: hypothetical protein ACD_3C00100G0016 [uncultured bacterium (gcode 4)]
MFMELQIFKIWCRRNRQQTIFNWFVNQFWIITIWSVFLLRKRGGNMYIFSWRWELRMWIRFLLLQIISCIIFFPTVFLLNTFIPNVGVDLATAFVPVMLFIWASQTHWSKVDSEKELQARERVRKEGQEKGLCENCKICM